MGNELGAIVIIHLGVIDIPYDDEATTGSVAEELEENYAVMGGFIELHINEVAAAVTDSLAGSLESLMMGAPLRANPFDGAMSKIEQGFRTYLDREEIAKLGRSGVPTKAAKQGKSTRFKREYGPRRPSFIDSGLYQTSFKAWVA